MRFLASINSPNVISYKQAFIDDESESLCIGKYSLCQMLYFIVMEYADDSDLFQAIKRQQKIK